MFSQKEISNIIYLYVANKQSMNIISSTYGCARNTIRNILIKNNIEIRKSSVIIRSRIKFDAKDKIRFWKKVDRKLDECWEWKASKDSCGYGRFGFRNELLSAHRVSYALSFGEIKEGLHVLHKCDNPGCCNPNHLFLGTHQDNMDDRHNKKRCKGGSSKGEVNPQHKFEEKDIIEIRQLYENGYKQKDIAEKFDTSQPVISSIILRKTWKHI